jgi:mannose-6-phosphate isomerase-like protein (cupin superfamily)
MKISRKDAVERGREGVKGYYYQLPEVQSGTTVAYAKFTGEHGERTIGDRARIYYILDGEGEVVINGVKDTITKDDLIVIPAKTTYNLWPTSGTLKVLLYLELLDFGK